MAPVYTADRPRAKLTRWNPDRIAFTVEHLETLHSRSTWAWVIATSTIFGILTALLTVAIAITV